MQKRYKTKMLALFKALKTTLVFGAILICLHACATPLTPCSKQTVYIPIIKKPPAGVLEACEIPNLDAKTNGDLLVIIEQLLKSNRDCASKVNALRAFYESSNTDGEEE